METLTVIENHPAYQCKWEITFFPDLIILGNIERFP
jgi:hypothetical protein